MGECANAGQSVLPDLEPPEFITVVLPAFIRDSAFVRSFTAVLQTDASLIR